MENKKQMNTADLLVKCLEAEGVEYIFGIPGEETLDIIDAIKNSSIKFIVTRHEQGAAFMADVYGRLTGKAGVCLSTLGPGATNLVTGVADANLDGAPLLAITGQVGTDKMHITSHQYLDLVHMFEPITKRSKQVVRPDTVTEIVRIAFKYAEMEKPGAVHIDLPNNIAKMPVKGEPLKKNKNKMGFTSYKDVEKASMLISKAENPLILVGSCAARNKVSDELIKFTESLKIPVVNTMMAKGVVPMDNKYSMWTVGIPQLDYVDEIIKRADLVIAVGYDIVEYNPRKWNGDNHAKIIHISTQSADINKSYEPELELVGEIGDTLNEIEKRAYREKEPEFCFEIRKKMIEDHKSMEADDSFPMKPQRVMRDIRSVMAADDIVISDVGANKMWIARHYDCYKPNTCIISNGFASMGIAVPGAIAAKLVNPDRRVLAVTGDGGFMMNSQELETALRIGTPIVVLILNDESYGLIKWKQEEQGYEPACIGFSNPDFKLYAESMHCKGYRVEKAEELVDVLEDAFSQNVPSIIDCRVDYSENIKLTEYLREIHKEL